MRYYCTEAVRRTVDYLETQESQPVCPDVQPGYLIPLLPTEAPQEAEPMERIFEDTEKYIVPGVSSTSQSN